MGNTQRYTSKNFKESFKSSYFKASVVSFFILNLCIMNMLLFRMSLSRLLLMTFHLNSNKFSKKERTSLIPDMASMFLLTSRAQCLDFDRETQY